MGKNLLLLTIAGIGVMWEASGQERYRFIENKGQWTDEIRYAARVPGGNFYATDNRFKLILFADDSEHQHEPTDVMWEESSGNRFSADENSEAHALFISFEGGKADKISGINPAPEVYHFYQGNNPQLWRTGVPAYRSLYYHQLYPGIDAVVASEKDHLKYDFRVAPGADPSVIRIHYQGALKLELLNGNIIITTSVGKLIEKKPYAFQEVAGKKVEIPCYYRVEGDEVTFTFPQGYDTCYELIIDPLLIFSTFSGSTADNWGSTATPGERGTLYSSGIVRYALGGEFPATAGAFQTTYGGGYDVALLKYDSTGTQLLYASFLGGASNETPHSLVKDYNDDLLVLGTTSSANFPVTSGAYQTTFNGGPFTFSDVIERYPFGSDLFIARISADGTQLKACTFLGGTSNDGLNAWPGPLTRNDGDQMRGDIITDSLGNVYISSVTASPDFPVVAGLNRSFGGLTDAVIVKMTANLNDIMWSSFLGGSDYDAAYSIKFDSLMNVVTGGGTNSVNFPVTDNAYQRIYAGNTDGWVAKISAGGESLIHATYSGTNAYDQIYFIDLNNRDDVFVFGQTTGNIPITPGVYHNPNSGQFIQRFTPDLSALIFSTRFGSGIGIPNISPTAFMVSECNNLYAAGWGGLINSLLGYWPSSSRTTGMPVTPDAYQPVTHGSDFYFIVLTEDASELLYATFLGGPLTSVHVDGGTSRFDKSGIVYHAVCAGCFGGYDDFPTTPGAWSNTNNSLNCNNAAFKLDLSTLRARLRTNTVDFSMPGITQLCYPDTLRVENLSTGGVLFQWDMGDGTRLTRYDKQSVLHQYQEEGVYTIRLKAIDLNTCLAVDSTQTVVRIYKNNASVQDDDNMCTGSSYQLQADGGAVYQWVSADNTFQSTLPQPVVTPEDTTTYYVTIIDFDGCVLRDTVTINVIPDIDLQFRFELIADCFSRPSLLLRNETVAKPDESFYFDFGDGFTSGLQEVVHQYNDDNYYSIRLVGVKEGCAYEKGVILPIFTIKVPNAFTPEGSPGFNDTFSIEFGQDGFSPYQLGIPVAIKILNRWGGKVYESNDYRNDWSAQGLDGGIYFYEIRLGLYNTCKGWVHVIK
ncbi:MAG: gliding motility-associated C-terminal domain-containing protein [Cyclobacteriaceae bacterium]|nr:gliding motility-associated C-terminal domain-containing protein [Cyclobacteriaceae bacterium]